MHAMQITVQAVAEEACELVLDTRDLHIHEVSAADGAQLQHQLGEPSEVGVLEKGPERMHAGAHILLPGGLLR